MINIKLTKEIKENSYFSSFTEDEIEIPNKPFIKQILKNIDFIEELDIENLQKAIETCIYFNIETNVLMSRFIKLGNNKLFTINITYKDIIVDKIVSKIVDKLQLKNINTNILVFYELDRFLKNNDVILDTFIVYRYNKIGVVFNTSKQKIRVLMNSCCCSKRQEIILSIEDNLGNIMKLDNIKNYKDNDNYKDTNFKEYTNFKVINYFNITENKNNKSIIISLLNYKVKIQIHIEEDEFESSIDWNLLSNSPNINITFQSIIDDLNNNKSIIDTQWNWNLLSESPNFTFDE
jgi:hypothetical protein